MLASHVSKPNTKVALLDVRTANSRPTPTPRVSLLLSSRRRAALAFVASVESSHFRAYFGRERERSGSHAYMPLPPFSC